MVNKRGQFFILAAVIIAVAVVGLMTIYNSVNTGDAPAQFYRYCEQLPTETGAVVDYTLYSGDQKVSTFVNQSAQQALTAYSDLDLFTCYADDGSQNNLICVNYGETDLLVYSEGDPDSPVRIAKGKENVETTIGDASSISTIAGSTQEIIDISPGQKEIVVESKDKNNAAVNYSIDLLKAASSASKYYFILKVDSTGGNYYTSQGCTRDQVSG